MNTITRDNYNDRLEDFRGEVLKAMDESMNRLADQAVLHFADNCTGARDADLPALFEGLDAQFKRNLKHGGIEAIIGADRDVELL